jgi:hypothetical protein
VRTALEHPTQVRLQHQKQVEHCIEEKAKKRKVAELSVAEIDYTQPIIPCTGPSTSTVDTSAITSRATSVALTDTPITPIITPNNMHIDEAAATAAALIATFGPAPK